MGRRRGLTRANHTSGAPIAASLPQRLLTFHFGRAQHPWGLNFLSFWGCSSHRGRQPSPSSGSWPSTSRPWESSCLAQQLSLCWVGLPTAFSETNVWPLRDPELPFQPS